MPIDPVVERQRTLADFANAEVPVRTRLVLLEAAAVQPGAALAEHQRTRGVVVDALQVIAVAVVFGVKNTAIELERIEHIPVQRTAILQKLVDSLGREPEHRPRMQQVVGEDAGRQAVVIVLVPIAPQAALLTKINVVAPGRLGVAPVGGLVDEGFAA
ncbi:hypothetical protein D3C79_695830 [compost metagenome]